MVVCTAVKHGKMRNFHYSVFGREVGILPLFGRGLVFQLVFGLVGVGGRCTTRFAQTAAKPLIFLVLLAAVASAWSCQTHAYICQQAGLEALNCCLADQNRSPAMVYHHCEAGAWNCSARVKAAEYLNAGRLEIAAHLYADALSPPHWGSYSCHSSFEGKVDRRVASGVLGWNVSSACDGGVLYADAAYLRGVAMVVWFEVVGLAPARALFGWSR